MGGRKQRLGWALTGSGHFFSECLEIMTRLEDLDIFVSKIYIFFHSFSVHNEFIKFFKIAHLFHAWMGLQSIIE